MLKLEKVSRDGMISVIVRDKERLFTESFLYALSFAVVFHLSLFFLFNIAPFSMGISKSVFPPTRVEAATPFQESAIAEVKTKALTIRGLPPPPSTEPQLLSKPQFIAIRPVENVNIKTKNTFIQFEKEIYQPSLNLLTKLPKKPFEIIVSGTLSKYSWQSNGLNTITGMSNQLEEWSAVYSVIVEGKTGKIFWFEPIQQIPNTLKNLAESILQNMQFASDPNVVATHGGIELHFNGVSQ